MMDDGKSLNENIKKFWGDELVTYPFEFLENSNLSLQTISFLQSVGLPDGKGLLASRIEKYLVLSFYNSPSLGKRIYVDSTFYFNFAADPGLPDNLTCINENTQEIVLFDKSDKSVTFINSGIVAFLLFLQIYLEKWLLIPEKVKANPNIAGQMLQNITEQFNAVDSKALENEENLWSLILEELGYEYTEWE